MQADDSGRSPALRGGGRAAGPGVAGAAPILRLILYLAFTLSGLTGLVYEATWTRYLQLFLGHAAYAQVLVLSLFMGGMAVGVLLTSRLLLQGLMKQTDPAFAAYVLATAAACLAAPPEPACREVFAVLRKLARETPLIELLRAHDRALG